MYLHLGADTVVPLSEVTAILDLRIAASPHTEEFLKKMKTAKKIVDISDNNAKSFIITDKVIYLSTISALTLKKRAYKVNGDEENDDDE